MIVGQPKFYEADKIPKSNRSLRRPMTPIELRYFIEKRPWYQTFDFGGGMEAHGAHPSEKEVDGVLPETMTLLRYLDIGSNQGFQVLSAAMRGATAYGIDNKKNQVETANKIATHFGIKAVFTLMDIMDVRTEYHEYKRGFDYITMMSVFHHFRHPIGAIENAYGMLHPGGFLVGEFCCWTPGERRWIRADEIPKDWGADYHKAYPTVEAVEKMLKKYFKSVEIETSLKAEHRIVIRSRKK